jgi:hypothetical protein
MKREHALRWMVCGVAVAAALTAVGPMALSQSRAETNAPPIAFDLPKTRFLSTESAEGSLVVHNTTSERLRYDPFGTTIVPREDDGTTVDQRLITSIILRRSWPCAGTANISASSAPATRSRSTRPE